MKIMRSKKFSEFRYVDFADRVMADFTDCKVEISPTKNQLSTCF